MPEELLQPVVELPVAEGNRDAEIVCLECLVKPDRAAADQSGKPYTMEIAKAGESYYIMAAGQFVKMTRARANWHVERSLANDPSNTLMLKIATLEEVQAKQAAAKKEAAAKANEAAQAKKDAEAAAKAQAEADEKAAKVRLDLVKKAVDTKSVESEEVANGMTDEDLQAAIKAKK